MLEDLQRSEVLNWCRNAKKLYPLRTTCELSPAGHELLQLLIKNALILQDICETFVEVILIYYIIIIKLVLILFTAYSRWTQTHLKILNIRAACVGRR